MFSGLSYFAEIVNQSRKAYNVTDFFSDSTNHVLHLAYAITKELFLPNNPVVDASLLGCSDGFDHNTRNGTNLGRTFQESFRRWRVRNWTEAFLKYPRAYLRISTCVDYSLANGCLPQENCLPLLVRQVTSFVFQISKLPMAMSTSYGSCSNWLAGRQYESQHNHSSKDSCVPLSSNPTFPTNTPGSTSNGVETSNRDTGSTRENCIVSERDSRVEKNISDKCRAPIIDLDYLDVGDKCGISHINLDYFDLESDPDFVSGGNTL